MSTSKQFEVDEDTKMERVDNPNPKLDDKAVYKGFISDRWNLGATPEGGYLFLLLLKSLGDYFEKDHPHPFTATANFLNKPEQGECHFHIQLLKKGGSFSTAQSSLVQKGEIKLHMVATFGDLRKRKGPTKFDTNDVLNLPPVEECPLMDELNSRKSYNLSFYQRVEVRRNPAKVRTNKAEIEGYIRLADGKESDPMVVGLLADCFRPPVTNYGSEVVGRAWFPTMEQTVYWRNLPSPGWLKFSNKTRHLIDGTNEVDGELWDSEGKLVAQSRQMALILPWSRNEKPSKIWSNRH